MKDDTSIFGAKSDNLDRLLRFALEPPEEENQAAQTASLDTLTEKPGGRIDKYKLLRILGEGGMGIVYLAEQEEPVRRQVALKVIKPGMDSKRVITRFEAEKQTLALMQHPNIAGVYDAGLTLTGRPYFVMEYVKGMPITEYCDHHKLPIKDRLRLFQQVCFAVHHAHQKGIIHRDIKPSNILVSTQNDNAVPKIIDFGVAKAISRPLTERTLLTEDSQLLGTPEYMSPEQAGMATEDIDTRSDIYSLGVLLYVLLTGVLPFDSDTLRTGGIDHIRQVIRETDPKTPSTRLTKLGEEAMVIAQNRRMEIQILAKHLRKELEWIPLKAMRKERSERYRSALELADDIENYLKGNPLIAGPPNTVYHLKKFVHRNRALVTGVVSVLAVLVAGIIVSTFYAVRADRASAESKAIADFLTNDVLASVVEVKGREATAADILNAASKSLQGRFDDQPQIEADICWRLSTIYRRLGDHRSAIPYLARLYQLRRERLGEHKGDTNTAKNYLALAYNGAGQYSEAERLFDELIEFYQQSNPENVGMLPWLKCNISRIYIGQGRYEEAERLLVKTLSSSETAWWKRYRPEGKPYLDDLAEIYLYWGKYEQAEKLFKETVESQGREGTSDPGAAVYSMDGLGRLYMAQEHFDKAEEQFKKGIDFGNHELPGKDHPLTLRNINDLAVLYTKQKKYEDADRLFDEVLEARKRKLGDDHPDTLESKNDLAMLYKEQGRYEEAEKYLLEAVRGRLSKLGDKHPQTIESLKNLIDLYESWNRPEKAEEWRAKLQQTKSMTK
jgi:serine/threonine protein kinase/Flp pilus assembly protein TadD